MPAAPAWSLCTDWITDEQLTDGCAACETDLTHVSETDRAYAITLASQVLFELTGRRWPGLCTTTNERPCGRHVVGCCDCPHLSAIRLSNGPVDASSIVVTADGEVVPTDEYALIRGRMVIGLTDPLTGIRRVWPCCQRLDLPLTEEGTLAFTYQWGNLPPEGSVLPATFLARDYALACASGGQCSSCSIPEDVQNLVRQGMSMAIPDPKVLLSDGFTGVGITDAWLASLRFGAKARRATASRPSGRQAQRVQ
jgi:hypothetical protein